MTIVQQPAHIDLFGVNPCTLKIMSDTTGQQNHSIKVQLQRQIGSGSFQDIPGGLMVAPVINFYASFNLSKRLPFLYNLPSLSSSAVQLANEMAYRWKAKITEHYGIPPIEQGMTMATGHALFGGVGRIKARTYDFFSDFNTRKAFLTNQPAQKLVRHDQPEWLYYPQVQDQYNFATIKVDLVFANGLTNTVDRENFSLEKGKVYMIPVGYTQLGLEEEEPTDSRIISYSVRLVHAPGQDVGDFYDAETRHFTLDFDVQSWPVRYYLFRNQLGGMDTVAARGKRTETHSAKSNVRTTYYDGDQPAANPYFSNINTVSEERVKQNVGWLGYDARRWLGGLVKAGLAWEIIDGQFVPILLQSDSVDTHTDDVSLQDFTFDFSYSPNEMI